MVEGYNGAIIEVNSETDFVSKNDSFHRPAIAAAKLVSEKNPAIVGALSALAYEQDGFGPDLEDVRRAWSARSARTCRSAASSASKAATWRCTCRHPHRCGGRVRRQTRKRPSSCMHVAAMKPWR
ncbi:hypothetical protein [Comamonas sp. JC664]|uniref:hypothetical protein n=1 Tax=Comamonas sp. JC664 TaxID=2801917 RepID=UPI00360F0586